MRTAFIVSTGRTGTGFFTKLFNDAVPDAWSLHEPRPAFRRRARALMHRSASLYEKLYFKLPRVMRHRRHAETWYVEANYQLFAAIPMLREIFPDTRIIHIVRDGRDVVSSYLNRFRYITTRHIVPANLPRDPAAAVWDTWTPLQKNAWYWAAVNRHIRAQQPDVSVRFEDVFGHGHEGLFRILDALPGLAYDRGRVLARFGTRVNRNATEFFPRYDEWPAAWREAFWEIAGDEMAVHGYGARGPAAVPARTPEGRPA